MLFDNLYSEVIKQSLMAKLQYSLGYKLIAAVKRAKLPTPMNFETGLPDDTNKDALKYAKRAFVSFGDYCMTQGYQIDTIEAIIESYIKGTGKQPSNTNAEIINARARISGLSPEKLQMTANNTRERAIAKQKEDMESLKAEFMDLEIYNNGFYQQDVALDNSGLNDHNDSYIDTGDLIKNSWVIENYPKAVKIQIAYWTRWNNWDDAEVMLIEEDQKTIDNAKD